MALELDVVGLMNVQMAVQGEDIYVLEVNPRASRTVPFVSVHRRVAGQGRCARHGGQEPGRGRLHPRDHPDLFQRQGGVPFAKFPGVDTILGPEMKSTGEVMGVGDSFAEAFARPSWCK